jgi:hypothetical protein
MGDWSLLSEQQTLIVQCVCNPVYRMYLNLSTDTHTHTELIYNVRNSGI